MKACVTLNACVAAARRGRACGSRRGCVGSSCQGSRSLTGKADQLWPTPTHVGTCLCNALPARDGRLGSCRCQGEDPSVKVGLLGIKGLQGCADEFLFLRSIVILL